MRRAIAISLAVTLRASSTTSPSCCLRTQDLNAWDANWDMNASSSPKMSHAAPTVFSRFPLRWAATGTTLWRMKFRRYDVLLFDSSSRHG